MVEIDWRFVLAFLVVQGGIILAAAKSIFITKSKIYDIKGMTIFIPRDEMKDLCKERRDNFDVTLKSLNEVAATVVSRSEWEGSYKEREQRHNEDQKRLCKKLDDLTEGQIGIEKGLAKLYGLFEKKGI